MRIFVVCAWYEVGMRHYSFTVLKNLKENLPAEYSIKVLLVLRNDVENYPELAQLEGMDIEYVVIKNALLNIASKVFAGIFDRFLLRKVRKYGSDVLYILFEGLYFKEIDLYKKKTKVIYTIHDLTPHEKNKQSFKDRWLSKQENKRGEDLMRESDYLVTNSYFQYLKMKDIGKDNIFYANMPTLINPNIANGGVIPPELKTEEYILFFGRIDKYKGLDILIKTHLESKVNIPLVIAGSGNFWFEVPESPNIILINRYIKDEELKYLFENARAAVMPYTAITQTSLISIPFYFKCPVILSNIKEFEEVSEKSKSPACDFSNVEDYRRNVSVVAEDETSRSSIIEGQTLYYLDNYDDKKFSEKMHGVFDSIKARWFR